MNEIGQLRSSVLILGWVLGCSTAADDHSGTSMQPSSPSAPAEPPALAPTNTAGAGPSSAPEMAGSMAPMTVPISPSQPVPANEPPPPSEPAPADEPAAPSEPDLSIGEPGLLRENGALIFRTESFTIPAGGERYLCWTTTTEEALKVRTVEFRGSTGVHHLTFAQTIWPEPAGFSECEILLKTTWVPLFSAGAGANELSLPAGVAHELAAGTQLLVQLHLLNPTDKEVTKTVALKLETTDEPNTEAVQIGGIGSFQISLPPHQKSKITSECSLPNTSRVVALMPHMHQLATSMILELGTSANDLQPIYTRDPWDFDQQSIDNVDMKLDAGKYARVTCNYDNTTDRTVAYGESSLDEMCFLGFFWVGTPINCVVF